MFSDKNGGVPDGPARCDRCQHLDNNRCGDSRPPASRHSRRGALEARFLQEEPN